MVGVAVRGGAVYTLPLSGTRYSGEKIPGDLDGWAAIDLDINRMADGTYDTLSARSETLYHTYAPVIGAVDKQTDYAVGDGLYFRSQPDHHTLGVDSKASLEWGRRFQHLLNYEFSRLNFYQKQNTLFRSALIYGDSLLYFLRGEDEFDLIEYPGHTIDSTFGREEADGSGVILGIIHDRFMRRRGFVDRGGNVVPFKDGNGRQNVVQHYFKKHPRQLRGLPLAYAIISLAKNDDRHWDATLDTAILESMFFAHTASENPQDTEEGMRRLAGIGGPKKQGPIGSLLESLGNLRRMRPGNMVNMKTGESMNLFDKKTPGATFAAFKENILNFIGMATGTPPEVITGKYSTSYTAHKGALNDFQKSYMFKRYRFIDDVCYPAMREIAANMVISGAIEAPGFFDNDYIQRAWLSGIWLGPIPGYINPLQEITARALSVENGFENRADAMFHISGSDYDDAMKEHHRQEALFTGTPEEQRAERLAEDLKQARARAWSLIKLTENEE